MNNKLKYIMALICFYLCVALCSPLCNILTDDIIRIVPDANAQNHDESSNNNRDVHSSNHGDPFAAVFQTFTIILICAVIGRYAAHKLKQSPVLGELAIGIIVGAILYQTGGPTVTIIRHYDEVQKITQKVLYEHKGWKDAIEVTLGEANLPDKTVEKLERVLMSESFPKYFNLARSVLLFSSLGVVLLLFMVGLECSLEEMKEVGGTATVVALLGVIIPFILGYATTLLILPVGIDSNVPIFIGATLCATSIGITARVFKDMNRLGMGEAKIVMSAAVLDDILGLIILAIVTGIVTSGSIEVSTIVMIFLKASIFLSTVLFVGTKFLKQQIAFFSKLDQSHVRLIFPFSLLMILAWLADAIGLATIIGAFAAGLIIKEEYFTRHHGEHSVESIIAPIEGIFAPVFFVLMGLQVDVSVFTNMEVLVSGLALTIVAIIGKMAASLILKKGNNKLIVGIGLVPRGEVGLIFASIGKSIGVLDDSLFSVIIVVVLLTTMVTPPMLKWAIERKERSE